LDRKSEIRPEFLFTALCFLLTLLLAATAGYLVSQDPLFRATLKLSLQAELLAHHYVGEFTPEQLFRSGWRGMQEAIPFPVTLSRYPSDASPHVSLRSYGLSLISLEGEDVVYSVDRNSVFAGALRPGDLIRRIGDHDPSSPQAVRLLGRSTRDSITIHFERADVVDSLTLLSSDIEFADNYFAQRHESLIYIYPDKLTSGISARVIMSLSLLLDTETRGLILDLRSVKRGSYSEARLLADLLLSRGMGDLPKEEVDLLENLQKVILVDEDMGDCAVNLARILKNQGLTAIGSGMREPPTSGFPVPLFTGDTLFLQIEEEYSGRYESLAEFPEDSLLKSLDSKKKASRKLTLDIEVAENRVSPLVADLRSQGLFFRFVLDTDYEKIPTREEENELVSKFLQYLERQSYYFDPLRELINRETVVSLSSEIKAAVERLQQKVLTVPYADPASAKDDLISELLWTIQQVKVSKPAAVDTRLRSDDETLRRAVRLLNDKS
jgi:hypothetical protein